MNVAIYPRKSKASDSSQSMEQQIAGCKRYIEEHYAGSNIEIFDGDYALTGHSTKKRKDFLRMMEKVRAKEISLVVIMRYDRIARNMRDFCNLYHDMEENGCNLVSVSQQIDTSTPYGKNFMYQMAAMAELEWAIISERYKDTAKYKREHGYAYTGRVPYGYKVEKQEDGYKRIVKDKEKDAMVVFDYYRTHKNKSATVRYIRENYYPNFTYDMLRIMLESDMYLGKVKGNNHFCEPYLTEQELLEIRQIKIIKQTKSKKHYLFSKLIICPVCGLRMVAMSSGSTKAKGYRCGIDKHLRIHKDIYLTEWKIEEQLITRLDAILEDKIIKASVVSKNKNKASTKQIEALQSKLDRLNYMFENGRLDIEDYERKYKETMDQIEELKQVPFDYENVKKSLPSNWKDIYAELDAEHRKIFWHNILSDIVVDTDKKIVDIRFV